MMQQQDYNLFNQPVFSGSDFIKDLDQIRLTGQIERIFSLMKDQQFRTLSEIEKTLNELHKDHYHPAASISAQLRNLRKIKVGGQSVYTVERRRRGNPGDGLFEYSVRENKMIY